MNLVDLFGGVRPAVVISNDDRDGHIGSWYAYHVSIIVVIHHRQACAARICPYKQGWNLRRPASTIHSDIKKCDSMRRQRSNQAASVAGDIRHLGAGGLHAKAPVKR